MTATQWEKTCESLVDTLAKQAAIVQRLQQTVVDLNSRNSGLETYMHNIRGMAESIYPDLKTVTDQYEAIRQAFHRMSDKAER